MTSCLCKSLSMKRFTAAVFRPFTAQPAFIASLFLSHSKSLIGPLGPGEQEVMRAEQSEERVGN